MGATFFDTATTVRELEAAGMDRRQAETIATACRKAADAGEPVTRPELGNVRLWMLGLVAAIGIAVIGWLIVAVGIAAIGWQTTEIRANHDAIELLQSGQARLEDKLLKIRE